MMVTRLKKKEVENYFKNVFRMSLCTKKKPYRSWQETRWDDHLEKFKK